MIIKVKRLQAWAPAGGGERVGRRPPPSSKVFWLYWGPFCYFFFIYGGFFATSFSFLGAFSPWGAFLLYGGGLFFGLSRSPTKISAGAHDCKEGSRACSPEIFCVTQFSEFWTCFVTILP